MRRFLLLLIPLLGGCSSLMKKEEKIAQDVEKLASDGSMTVADAKQILKDVQEE